jgi:hypothetical protein
MDSTGFEIREVPMNLEEEKNRGFFDPYQRDLAVLKK